MEKEYSKEHLDKKEKDDLDDLLNGGVHYFGDAVTRSIVDKVRRSLRGGGFFFIRCKSVKDKAYGVGEKVGEDMYFDEWTRHFFRPEYMADILSGFETAAVSETEEDYFGLCHFVDGIAVKAVSVKTHLNLDSLERQNIRERAVSVGDRDMS